MEGLDPAVRLLDRPEPVPLPPSLQARLLGPAVRLGLALAVGVGLALVWHYLDPTVRGPEELEALDLPVVASIPKE